jgi:hypothetical protein
MSIDMFDVVCNSLYQNFKCRWHLTLFSSLLSDITCCFVGRPCVVVWDILVQYHRMLSWMQCDNCLGFWRQLACPNCMHYSSGFFEAMKTTTIHSVGRAITPSISASNISLYHCLPANLFGLMFLHSCDNSLLFPAWYLPLPLPLMTWTVPLVV